LPYFTRVLSKDDAFPTIDELREVLRAAHPGFRLSLEEGDEEEWEALLLATDDEVEVAVLERKPVYDGSTGRMRLPTCSKIWTGAGRNQVLPGSKSFSAK
jgi:hypothetical protein